MTPHNLLVAEILLVADKADSKAAAIRAVNDAGEHVSHGHLEDHRTEVICELLDAIERVHPGLGTRLQNAMHPLVSDEALADEVPA